MWKTMRFFLTWKHPYFAIIRKASTKNKFQQGFLNSCIFFSGIHPRILFKILLVDPTEIPQGTCSAAHLKDPPGIFPQLLPKELLKNAAEVFEGTLTNISELTSLEILVKTLKQIRWEIPEKKMKEFPKYLLEKSPTDLMGELSLELF